MEENSARESERVRSLLKKLPAFFKIPNVCFSVQITSSRDSLTLSTRLFIWYISRGTCCCCYTERAGDRMWWLRFTTVEPTGSDKRYWSNKIMTLYYPSICTYVSQVVSSLKIHGQTVFIFSMGITCPSHYIVLNRYMIFCSEYRFWSSLLCNLRLNTAWLYLCNQDLELGVKCQQFVQTAACAQLKVRYRSVLMHHFSVEAPRWCLHFTLSRY